jgi:hypothetical protein
MNCEEFLPALETGGLWRRMRARRHAAGCPRCAAVYAAFRAAKIRLATPEPLPRYAREIWNRAAIDAPVRFDRRVRWTPAVACLAAAACLLIVFVGPAVWEHVKNVVNDGGRSQETVTISTTSVIEVDPIGEFSELAEAAGRLDGELESLRMVAQRRDAQREVMLALNQYGTWSIER